MNHRDAKSLQVLNVIIFCQVDHIPMICHKIGVDIKVAPVETFIFPTKTKYNRFGFGGSINIV